MTSYEPACPQIRPVWIYYITSRLSLAGCKYFFFLYDPAFPEHPVTSFLQITSYVCPPLKSSLPVEKYVHIEQRRLLKTAALTGKD